MNQGINYSPSPKRTETCCVPVLLLCVSVLLCWCCCTIQRIHALTQRAWAESPAEHILCTSSLQNTHTHTKIKQQREKNPKDLKGKLEERKGKEWNKEGEKKGKEWNKWRRKGKNAGKGRKGRSKWKKKKKNLVRKGIKGWKQERETDRRNERKKK